MFERFTDRARRVLVWAQEEARLLNHSFIGTEHLLLGLLREDEGIGAAALHALDITLEAVRVRVDETIGLSGTPPTGSPPFTPRAKKVLELSLRDALQLGHNYIGTEHILLGLVREGEGVAAQVLVSMGADLARVRQQVIQLLSGYGGKESIDQVARPSNLVTGRGPQRGELVACSFCGRRHPDAGQVIAGRSGAFVCEHCVREWVGRLEGDAEDGQDDGGAGAGAGHFVAHFYGDEAAQPTGVSTMDMGLAEDPDDSTRIMVRITGVPDGPGIVAHLFQALASHPVDVTEIVAGPSVSGMLEISFAVSKATEPAFMSAYSGFHDSMLGPGQPS